MSDDLIKRSDAIRAVAQDLMYEACVQSEYASDELSDWIEVAKVMLEDVPSADRPQGEFTKREYEQFLHGISLSLLSKRSAQHWGYEEETAQKIRWLEALEQKVRAKMKGADDETD